MALLPISRRLKPHGMTFPFFVLTQEDASARISCLLGIEATEEEARSVAQSWVRAGKSGVFFGFLDRSFTTPVQTFPTWINK